MSRAHTDNVDESELIVLNGCWCGNTQFECNNKGGCTGEQEIACVQMQCCLNFEDSYYKVCSMPPCCHTIGQCIGCGCSLLCDEKGGTHKADSCCQLGLLCCALGLKVKNIGCCMSQLQCCCCVQSVAIPPNKEVPSTLALLGLQCYPKCGCCRKLKSLSGAPPTAQEMLR